MAAPPVTYRVPDRLPPEPYPGLRSFEYTEWGIFFGREPMIDVVITRLAKHRLVIVHGASGCGKSSLIRAGVFPWLGLDHARSGKDWLTAVVRPGGGPLRNIAQALAKTLGPPASFEGSPDEAVAAWHDRLAMGSSVLSEVNGALESRHGTSFCLLIDQFEELFRYAKETNRDEARLVVEILKAVANPDVPPEHFFVVLTMRSDYLGECSQFEGFAETVNSCQYLLPRLDDFALLRAIHEPAELFNGKIDPVVGDRLIFAARQQHDALPILQHALMRACIHARERHGSGEGWTVLPADLDAVEGKDGALSQHADEVLAELTASDPLNLKAAEWLFRSLTELNAEGNVVRRPCSVATLISVASGDRRRMVSVIEAFGAAGRNFLTINPPGPPADDSEIDVSHEALIRSWKQLSDPSRDPGRNQPIGWVWREFEDGQRWRALAVQARVFRDDITTSAVLSPATTDAYQTWWAEHTSSWAARYAQDKKRASEEYDEVEDLWQASNTALDFERSRLKREAHEQERQQSRRRLFNIVVIAFVFVSALATVAIWQWAESQRAQNRAEKDKQGTLDAYNRLLGEKAKADQAYADADNARKEALAALKRSLEESLRADQASDRANKFQSGLAESYVASYGSNPDTLKRALTALTNESDPIQVAFFGQVVSQLATFATPSQVWLATESLIQQLGKAPEPAAASAITQALASLASRLNAEQAQAVTDKLLRAPQGNEAVTDATALALGAINPKLTGAQLIEMQAYLFEALLNTSNPKVASYIVTGLTNLRWSPTAAQSEQALPHVLDLLRSANDPAFVASFAKVITAMAPMLGQADVKGAISAIQSLGTQYGDLLTPTLDSLTRRSFAHLGEDPIYLDQGPNWTTAARTDFYTRDQGSRLIDLVWLQALKRADGQSFLSDELSRYGFLPNPADTVGLPIGFQTTGSRGFQVVGVTCSACHTRQLEIGGKIYRADGGPAFVDFQAFLNDLDKAVGTVTANDASFAPFAAAVLQSNRPAAADVEGLRQRVNAWYRRFHAFVAGTLPRAGWGLGRMDAFGLIFNRLSGLDVGPPPDLLIPGNIRIADAPVRYSFLWNAPQQDKSAWAGFVPNGNDLLALSRNTGHTLAFASLEPKKVGPLVNYLNNNSINFDGLDKLEGLARQLGPPKWPFAINANLAANGKVIFARECGSCHDIKVSPSLAGATWFTPVQNVGSDTRQHDVLAWKANTGVLKGAVIPGIAAPLKEEDYVLSMMSTVVIGSIAQHLLGGDFLGATGNSKGQQVSSIQDTTPQLPPAFQLLADANKMPTRGAYAARVLQGVWAAAPYLHNGSVPTLADLLKPSVQRPLRFRVGARYDIEKIGIAATQDPSNGIRSVTDCSDVNSGNSNCGHEFGTSLSDQDKRALLEYLKAL